MKKWKEVRLGDYVKKIGSGITPTGGSSVYSDSGTALIRSQNIYNSKFHYDGLAYINDDIAKSMVGVELFEKDILLNITGDSVARCTIVPLNVLPARVNQHVAIIRPTNDFDNSFLMYYLISPQMQLYLLSISGSGGTRKALTKVLIENLKIPLPPLPTQQRIAAILSSYDDLIENNRRRITLLEDSARLLYKEWFVKFQFPGHEKVKVKNGLPEGWERKKLGEIVDFLSRGISPTYNDDAELTVINQKCIRNNLLDLSESRKQSKAIPNEKQIRTGDILLNSTGTGTLGRSALVVRRINNCTVDSHVTIVRAKENIGYCWLSYLMSGLELYFENLAEGATNQKELSRSRLRELDLVLPKKSVISLFEEYTIPLKQQILTLQHQTQKLREARNILLPKLMNGTIEV